jgi:hypothetical protein
VGDVGCVVKIWESLESDSGNMARWKDALFRYYSS